MIGMTLRGIFAASLLAAAAFAALPVTTTAVSAQDYPWCAVYPSGSENCGFTTQAQCKGTVSGNGGFCRMTAVEAMSAYAAEPKRRRK